MRVVIAEDNALLRQGLVLLPTSSGHEAVDVVGTGPEALPALLEHRPAIAVLDVRMPPGFRDEGLRAACEREVLALMAESHDNTTIAKALVVTERSVSKHIGNVFLKLGLPPAACRLPPSDSGHRRVLAVLAYLEGRAEGSSTRPPRWAADVEDADGPCSQAARPTSGSSNR
ncbi:response regulator transcription factor [Streptomyces sp. NPDC087422]|uniref:response regulator transcription factor n=1 Tax=Streptomyces sp. NPDC087422 TaxID=3365786 RepID=UPI003805C4E7